MDTFPVVLVPLKSVQINVNGRVHKFDPPSMDNVNEYITLQKCNLINSKLHHLPSQARLEREDFNVNPSSNELKYTKKEHSKSDWTKKSSLPWSLLC